MYFSIFAYFFIFKASELFFLGIFWFIPLSVGLTQGIVWILIGAHPLSVGLTQGVVWIPAGIQLCQFVEPPSDWPQGKSSVNCMTWKVFIWFERVGQNFPKRVLLSFCFCFRTKLQRWKKIALFFNGLMIFLLLKLQSAKFGGSARLRRSASRRTALWYGREFDGVEVVPVKSWLVQCGYCGKNFAESGRSIARAGHYNGEMFARSSQGSFIFF